MSRSEVGCHVPGGWERFVVPRYISFKRVELTFELVDAPVEVALQTRDRPCT